LTINANQDIRAIAIDPGGTTGITMATKEGKRLELRPFQEKMTPTQLWQFLHENVYEPTFVICESFEFRRYARAGLDLTPAQLIGVVRAFTDDTNLYMQTAYYAKGGFFTDRTLKEKNLYIPARPHAMDSLRHFMQWFTFGPGYRFNNDPTLVLIK
jgi:hypothetical protein